MRNFLFHNQMRNAKCEMQNNKGFTLVELIIVTGLFGFITALLMQNLFLVYNFKDVIRYKKDLNFEAAGVLNNGIAGILRSGFAINYAETDTDKSNGAEGEGVRHEVDKISVFTNRAENRYFTIYREAYQPSGDNRDTARLMIAFSNGDVLPLNTSETVVEDFDVKVPKDPRVDGDQDIQPYVSIYLRVRRRYSEVEAMNTDEKLIAFQNVHASYQTTYTLRNVVPSSNK